MLDFGQLLIPWVLLVILFVSLLVAVIYLQKTTNKNHQLQTETLKSLLFQSHQTNLDLLNRLMSEDPRTYNLMSRVTQNQVQHLPHPSRINNDVFSAMSDTQEIQTISDRDGLGDVMYDDEFIEFSTSINAPRG